MLIAQDNSLDHEYLPIAGLPTFTSASAKLIFGADSAAIKEGRVSTYVACYRSPVLDSDHRSSQSADHLWHGCEPPRGAVPRALLRTLGWQDQGGEDHLRQQPQLGCVRFPRVRGCALNPPCPANHKAIFSNVGCTSVDYPYYDPKTISLAFNDFLAFLRNVPLQSVILVHACAHNPTGVDPTREQWKEIVSIFLERGLFAFLDTAYQGFASGSLDDDAWAVRHFTERGVPLLVCQSYAKNMGLYVSPSPRFVLESR